MSEEMLKVNFLSIAVMGLLMFVAGCILYVFRGAVSSYVRFLLPMPPIGVAAYIFVFNMFRHYDGSLPAQRFGALKEIMTSTAIAALIFFLFTALLVLTIHFIKQAL